MKRIFLALVAMLLGAMPVLAQLEAGQPGQTSAQQQRGGPANAPDADLNDQALIDQLPGAGKSLLKRMMQKAMSWRLKYYFVAQNAKNCDLFYGLVQDNQFIGLASVDFVFPSGCQCKGHALVTHYPYFRGVVGQKGWVRAKCSDGRSINGNFVTTSLTAGNGTATDSLGNQYQFTFGHTAEQAVQKVNELRRELHCPECNAQEIELKVEGQILRAR